ncbi:hypothetical protein L917_04213 [Phytophthora nicotianae]|uniref:MULE transposase domain-containing protein n=1 Tax=Phytophthora nicotianae TaxID=4792 RepID=W2LQ72_PHYNI|nr:hypothetical protein L917_04213 [Phytophthora nicotianae]
MFGWQLDNNTKPIVSNGSGEKSFIVDLSMKALILSQCEYPELVVGISDRSRKFHLVALFIISREAQLCFQAALLAPRRLCCWIIQKELVVCYAMVGGDRAQLNALTAAFGHNPVYQFLMCFFHVLKKVREATEPLSSGARSTILRDVYNMHVARKESVYLPLQNASLKRW